MADDFARQLLDALYNPETQPPQQPSRPLREKLAGAAETVGTLGSGLLASVPAGLAGLTQLIPTRGHRPSVNRAAEKVEEVQSALTRLPRTEAGQEYLEKTAGALGVLGMPAEFLGEQTLKLTGSPFLATAANVGLDPVNYIGMPGSGKAAVATGKALGRAAAAAPRVAGEMISDLVMPAPRAQAQRGAIDLGPQIPEFQPQTSLGLVSRADEALAALPRNKGTGAEFLRELEKTPGVRMAELEDRGLVEALSGMGKVTKADVIKALQDNPPVQLKEVMLGSESLTHRQKLAIEYDRAREESARVGGSTNPSYIERIPESNRTPEEQRLLEAWNRVDQSLEESWLSENPPPKYGQYTLPGGENYREILLTLPVKKAVEQEVRLEPRMANFGGRRDGFNAYIGDAFIGWGRTEDEARAYAIQNAPDDTLQNYRSGHWKEPNVLAHARISDRTGANGEKILHVEEVQSDWHQTGRKSGYKTGKEQQQLDEAKWQYSFNKGMQQDFYRFAEGLPEGDPQRLKYLQQANDLTPKLMKLDSDISRIRQAMEEGVPDAPFKKNWHELMMRRLVDYAAKNGYDRIAITPGAEQASRYDLSKQIESVYAYKQTGGSFKISAIDKNGNTLPSQTAKNEKELADIVGKDLAEKIVGQKGVVENYSGLDLQVGGEGMKGFYDKILPTYLNELGKPYGVKVGQDLLQKPDYDIVKKNAIRHYGEGSDAYNEALRNVTAPVHSFDITPQMREAIKSKGLPLYAKGGSVHISDNPDTMALELQVGGAVKAAKAASKAAEKAVPPKLPRAEPKTKAEIEAIAQRMAPQLTGEYVRKSPESAITVAGKTKRQFEREKDLPVELTGEAKTPTPVDIESLKGKAMMGILGDPSITGRELKSVGETRLASPAPQHGGPLYGMGREDEAFWASGKGAAQKVQNLAGEISKQYGTDVLGKYIMMGPEGLNYAQHFADANLQAIDLSKMTKKQVEQFDRMIRKGSPNSGPRPSFPGIEDKEGAYLHLAFDPELRKHFNALMQMPTITEAFNLPSGQDIRFAITEPLLRDLERGVSGMSVGQMRPGAELTRSSHPTYEMDIPGKFLGSSKYPVPYELMFPDTVKAIRENPRQAPHEFGSLGMVGPRQIIDQQMIDELKAYEEQIRKLTGKKKGGAVKKQAGGAIKAAIKAVKPTAEQAATMAAQRAELVLRSRAMQELKDQFENLPQPLKGFLSSESILQRMDEIRRREATPSGEQIPLLKKGGAIEMQAGGALKAAAKAAEKAAAQTASKQAAEQTVKSIYPQADALERARQNAVKMLGLPENNTAMDRARAMGYLYDTYHGTFGRFDDFDLSKANPRSQYMPGVFTADDPRLAENFGDYIMPLLQRKGTTVLDKRDARNAGLPLPKVDTIHDKDAGIRVTNRLENIRSRFAAFDPAEMDKPGLLKKNGGAAHKPAKKVAITDNLDTMRLAVQKRK